jgi:hypothetical protein
VFNIDSQRIGTYVGERDFRAYVPSAVRASGECQRGHDYLITRTDVTREHAQMQSGSAATYGYRLFCANVAGKRLLELTDQRPGG